MNTEVSSITVLQERVSLRQFREILAGISKPNKYSRVQQLALLLHESALDPRDTHNVIVQTLDGMPFGVQGPSSGMPPAERTRALGLVIDWLLTSDRDAQAASAEDWLKRRKTRGYHPALLLLLDQLILVPENAVLPSKSDAFVLPADDANSKRAALAAPAPAQQRGQACWILLCVAFLVVGMAAGSLATYGSLRDELSPREHSVKPETAVLVTPGRLMEVQQQLAQALDEIQMLRRRLFETTQLLQQGEAEGQRLREHHYEMTQQIHNSLREYQQLRVRHHETAQHLHQCLQTVDKLHAAQAQSKESKGVQATLEGLIKFMKKRNWVQDVKTAGVTLAQVYEELSSQLSTSFERIQQQVRDARQDYDACQRELYQSRGCGGSR